MIVSNRTSGNSISEAIGFTAVPTAPSSAVVVNSRITTDLTTTQLVPSDQALVQPSASCSWIDAMDDSRAAAVVQSIQQSSSTHSSAPESALREAGGRKTQGIGNTGKFIGLLNDASRAANISIADNHGSAGQASSMAAFNHFQRDSGPCMQTVNGTNNMSALELANVDITSLTQRRDENNVVVTPPPFARIDWGSDGNDEGWNLFYYLGYNGEIETGINP
jgi:hypothetical protein